MGQTDTNVSALGEKLSVIPQTLYGHISHPTTLARPDRGRWANAYDHRESRIYVSPIPNRDADDGLSRGMSHGAPSPRRCIRGAARAVPPLIHCQIQKPTARMSEGVFLTPPSDVETVPKGMVLRPVWQQHRILVLPAKAPLPGSNVDGGGTDDSARTGSTTEET